jgi:hypothetical protein
MGDVTEWIGEGRHFICGAIPYSENSVYAPTIVWIDLQGSGFEQIRDDLSKVFYVSLIVAQIQIFPVL